MRFFTREWVFGDSSAEESARVVEAHREHLQRIGPRVPAELLRLETPSYSLHDGIFRTVAVSGAASRIDLSLRCGDLQVGYCNLKLVYSGARLVAPEPGELRRLIGGGGSEVLYDEIDLANGGYEHRLLLAPTGEMVIRFDGVTVTREPVASRDVGMAQAPVVTVPSFRS